MARQTQLTLLPGGRPEPGEDITVNGKKATVITADFVTHVFKDDVAVRFPDGTFDLVSIQEVSRHHHSG